MLKEDRSLKCVGNALQTLFFLFLFLFLFFFLFFFLFSSPLFLFLCSMFITLFSFTLLPLLSLPLQFFIYFPLFFLFPSSSSFSPLPPLLHSTSQTPLSSFLISLFCLFSIFLSCPLLFLFSLFLFFTFLHSFPLPSFLPLCLSYFFFHLSFCLFSLALLFSSCPLPLPIFSLR